MPQREVATLAGGCFWCLEAAFQQLKGVEKVESGYAGGHVANPSYEQVCTGTTGHAEVLQITFDPAIISFDDLLHEMIAGSKVICRTSAWPVVPRSEEHTSELQSRLHLVCRLL